MKPRAAFFARPLAGAGRRLLGFTLLLLLSSLSVCAQNGRYDNIAISGRGTPIAGINVAVCAPMATTAASVSSVTGIATLTMASNPVTAGFVASGTINVTGFTGGDTYFNGNWTVSTVTSTSITFALTAATASASSNGSVYEQGSTTAACAPLATLGTSSSVGTGGTNPFQGDGLGGYGFWAAPGQYDIWLYSTFVTPVAKFASIACVPSNTANCGALLGTPNTWIAVQTFQNVPIFDLGFDVAETTIVSSVAGQDICYGDSTAHAIKCSYNNGTFYTVPLLGLAQTWSATQSFGVQPLPSIAGAVGFGSTAFPWANAIIGSAAANSSALSSLASANRSVVFPDQSGTVQLSCGSQTQFLFIPTGDFTTVQTTYAAFITGLSWTVPASTACNVPFTCHLVYSQQTAIPGGGDTIGFGAGAAGTNPTNTEIADEVWTGTGTSGAIMTGNLNLTSTTTTTVGVGFNPANINVLYNAEISGFIEQPSGLSTTYGISIATSAGADQLTVKRDSFCRIN